MILDDIAIGMAEWDARQLSLGWAPNTPPGEEHIGGDPILFDDGSVAQLETGTYDDWETEYAYYTHDGGLAMLFQTTPTEI